MICVSLKRFPNRLGKLLIVCLSGLAVAGLGSPAQAQKANPDDRPLFAGFRGVRIGMAADEARKKLGNPSDKGDELDLYLFNENQAVQVYYDKAKMVSAISIDFMSGAADIPMPKDVVGGEPDSRPDGSLYKMVRYPKAGYWIAYSKGTGNAPTITITMQKIEH